MQYLNTRLRGENATTLAQHLSYVLDRGLPALLNKVSNKPTGSSYNPDKPNTDLVGTINTSKGDVDIVVERVTRGNSQIWLFSTETLDAVPELYEEVNGVTAEKVLPEFLTDTTIAGIPLFQLLFVFVGMPLVYGLTGLLNRLISPLVGSVWRKWHKRSGLKNPEVLIRPIRLFLLVLVIRWMLATISLSLFARQFWSSVASVLTISAVIWLALIVNTWGEERIRKYLGSSNSNGSVAALRLAHRTVDLLVLFAGLLVALNHFGINVTAVLAGLGVGGIAVALAAQRTLENVIGGVSVVFDHAMQVGDSIKVAGLEGTIEDIGLRSTRVRTLDRSVVVIPNGQIANANIENLSSRDKFWLHPILSLQYETTAAQMRSALDAIRRLLRDHTRVEKESVRVRFLGFGRSSLDVEVCAYISAVDFGDFLAIQEELLLRFMDAIQTAGTRMALPAQTTYVASGSRHQEEGAAELLGVPVRNAL